MFADVYHEYGPVRLDGWGNRIALLLGRGAGRALGRLVRVELRVQPTGSTRWRRRRSRLFQPRAYEIDLPLSALGDRSGTEITVTTTQYRGAPVQRSLDWVQSLRVHLPARVAVLVELAAGSADMSPA